MRGGKFLAEETPENLLMQYQCETLEEVFLKLAIMQNKGKRRRSSIAQEISDQIAVPVAMTVSCLVFFFKFGIFFIFNSMSCDKNFHIVCDHNIKFKIYSILTVSEIRT